jgi:plastocyanin domain-containing protein
MSAMDWTAIAAGLAAIAWVNWYFFLARKPSAQAALAAGGYQEVTVAVQGGYEPAVVRVKAGVPVRLTFDRRETSGCSEEVVLPDFGLKRFLPAFQRTTLELTPPKAGEYEFTCGMNMLRGKLIAE